VEKGEFRRSKAVHEVTPSGSADMASAPDHLREFAGTADAADRFEKAMLDFVEEHLQDGGCEERTADAKDLKVGLFGDFLESRGHGQFVEWIPEPTGWVLRAVTDNGIIRVPRPVMIMEYVLKVCGTCVRFPHDYMCQCSLSSLSSLYPYPSVQVRALNEFTLDTFLPWTPLFGGSGHLLDVWTPLFSPDPPLFPTPPHLIPLFAERQIYRS
jgi:hypothetical protein